MRPVLLSEFRSGKGWGKFGPDSTVLLLAKKASPAFSECSSDTVGAFLGGKDSRNNKLPIFITDKSCSLFRGT